MLFWLVFPEIISNGQVCISSTVLPLFQAQWQHRMPGTLSQLQSELRRIEHYRSFGFLGQQKRTHRSNCTLNSVD
jgi:hypothetical protein